MQEPLHSTHKEFVRAWCREACEARRPVRGRDERRAVTVSVTVTADGDAEHAGPRSAAVSECVTVCAFLAYPYGYPRFNIFIRLL